jgi:hypothetical protein
MEYSDGAAKEAKGTRQFPQNAQLFFEEVRRLSHNDKTFFIRNYKLAK